MKRSTQVVLVCLLMLTVASWAAAQGTFQVPSGTPQPAMRFGNFIEIGNDVLMHIIASSEFVYNTTENFDFERKVRERVPNRTDTATDNNRGNSDTFWMQSRFG